MCRNLGRNSTRLRLLVNLGFKISYHLLNIHPGITIVVAGYGSIMQGAQQ